MKFKIVVVTVFLSLWILSSTFAAEPPRTVHLKTALELSYLNLSPVSKTALHSLSPSFADFQGSRRLKSPGKGMLLSLILPGTGEVYANSWIKGALFLGVEFGSWLTYSKFYNEGKDLEKEYLAFADAHWSKEKWQQWWDSLSDEARAVYQHHELPETKTQQYYEMIGKYMKYNAGWDDVTWNPGVVETDTSQLSLDYMALRGKSNDRLKLATTATAIILANHILSALDAVWSVRMFNKNIQASAELDYVYINSRRVPVSTLTFRW